MHRALIKRIKEENYILNEKCPGVNGQNLAGFAVNRQHTSSKNIDNSHLQAITSVNLNLLKSRLSLMKK